MCSEARAHIDPHLEPACLQNALPHTSPVSTQGVCRKRRRILHHSLTAVVCSAGIGLVSTDNKRGCEAQKNCREGKARRKKASGSPTTTPITVAAHSSLLVGEPRPGAKHTHTHTHICKLGWLFDHANKNHSKGRKSEGEADAAG